MNTTAKTTIHNALKALASVCDGANSEDGMGYNGTDSQFGKQLAMQASLSDKQATSALKMLRKYQKRQLSAMGIILPTKEEAEAEEVLSISVRYNRTYIVLYFTAIPDVATRTLLKQLGGYFDNEHKAWVMPNSDKVSDLVMKWNSQLLVTTIELITKAA